LPAPSIGGQSGSRDKYVKDVRNLSKNLREIVRIVRTKKLAKQNGTDELQGRTVPLEM